ncbi:MAG: hypothetical protein LQ337_009015, partial [Flavoplaca oasis]
GEKKGRDLLRRRINVAKNRARNDLKATEEFKAMELDAQEAAIKAVNARVEHE